jgi:6-pyruvoyltetrahydropterin/6-carboxytetrahydropterin synthase
MFELKVLTHFAAAHQLKMVAQKCENLHGHNWDIEVRVQGEQLNPAGVLMDFGDLKSHIAAIIEKLDHRFLNDLEAFGPDRPPSSEHIARYIAEALSERLAVPGVWVSQVTAWESKNACASYFPRTQARP